MKFGRLPRKFDPRVPHYSALRYKLALPAPPQQINYAATIPAIGILGNDLWGDCACAGALHLYELWVWNATGKMPTVTTDLALQLYSEVTGFDINAGPPNNNPTDQGTCLQDLLAYWLKTGIPLADGSRHKIAAYFEIDPLNATDLDLGTAESAGLYLGFNVPSDMQMAPGTIFDLLPGWDGTYQGGHCVVSAGYQRPSEQREIESWGETNYGMTQRFWQKCVDEAYVLISPDFQTPLGETPYGLSLADWDAQMAAIREAA